MNGSVIKRGNRWAICYYIGKDENGKWKQKWESGFSTKKEAQRVLRSRVEAVEASYGSKLSGITLGGFLRYWLDTYCQQNLAPNTIRGYRTNIEKHVIPILGTTPLIKISPKSLQDLYTKLLANGLSGTSVRYIHNNLHKALEYGVRLEAIPKNPANMVIPPKVKRYEAAILTPDQVITLLDSCKETELFWPVLLAVSLGLRRGEVLALRWEDVDLEGKKIHICHSALCENLGNFTISETKTKSSRRTLRLPDSVAVALKARQDVLNQRRALWGEKYNPMNLVCFREIGCPFTSNALRHQYIKVLQKAGLPLVRFHDLRHTNATLLLRNGIPAKIVSSILGHASIQLTMDTYSHVAPDMQEGAMQAMDDLLKKV